SQRLNLQKVDSIANLQKNLKEYYATYPNKNEDHWIIGHNWDQDYMKDNRYPDRYDLDVIISKQPVLLYRGCNHIAVLNSKALQLLNIDKDSIDPVGGQIDKDIQGLPTGILRENALGVVYGFIDRQENENRKNFYEMGLNHCLNVGLTSIQTNDSNAWEYYKSIQEEGNLPIRVYLTLMYSDITSGNYPKASTQLGLLKCDRVKFFSDGSLGASTAAMNDPYEGEIHNGIPIYTEEELTRLVSEVKSLGFRPEIHAIGDKAAEISINSMINGNVLPDDRGILTHCQILSQSIINKMAEHNIIANIQPSFVTTDSKWIEKRIGTGERLKYAYAWKTLLKNNVPVAGGSDAPIEDPNPLLGMYSAIYRLDPDGIPWRPEECISFEEAIAMYTVGGSYAQKEESRLGLIKAGYLADFIVLDHDVHLYPEQLPQTSVLQVWVNGIRRK
ncbi:MAG: amidohydrolase, partial [Candidatus Heimdallarchaeota archaeon]|nr:amidohydrolase [Candidatus Heimdallarchaeota archaeon]